MTRWTFINITTITLQISLIILASLMDWYVFGLFVKIGAPLFLILIGLLSLNDNICHWLTRPLFKRKNIDDDLNFL
jgi:hypothetical protein